MVTTGTVIYSRYLNNAVTVPPQVPNSYSWRVDPLPLCGRAISTYITVPPSLAAELNGVEKTVCALCSE
jgi:hypothetical protein